jgi:hypothetical protein
MRAAEDFVFGTAKATWHSHGKPVMEPAMRILLLAFTLCLPQPTSAQDAPRTGTILFPQGPSVIYDRPPNAVFGEPAAPTAVVRGSQEGAEIFRVEPDPANPGSFALAPDAPVASGGLEVLGSVEVFQGNKLQQWIQVAPKGSGRGEPRASLKGWTVYDPQTLSPDM